MTASPATEVRPGARAPRHVDPQSRRPLPHLASWLPLLVFGVPALLAVNHYGAPARDLLVFVGYITGLVAAPGVLLWRAARQRARPLAEDIGPGLALGYVLEVLAYFVARAVGHPSAVALAPVAVLVAFVAARPLRRYWRAGADAERVPVGWLWANAAIAGTVLIWSALYFMRSRGVDYTFPDGDLPFQLALIGELRHHLPPQVPWVQGEPLSYHWFAYADMAATSWVTGIAPQTLLLRLFFVPLLAALPFAISTLARQVTGRWWPGPVAAVITLAGVAPSPYGWEMPLGHVHNGLGPVEDGVILRLGLFASPTQTFAALVAVGLVVALVEILHSPVPGWRQWLLLASFVAVVCGAKATYLPLVLGGLLLVVAVTLMVRRRWHRQALGCLALVVPGVLFAQFVLFHGAAQGMVVKPLGGLGRYGLGGSTGLGGLRVDDPQTTGIALATITAVTLLAWAMIWGGAAAGLLRGTWRDPACLALVGMGVAAFSAVLLLNHYGFSQTWFLVAARPYLAVAAVAGLALLASGGGDGRPGRWLAVAVGIGAGAAWTVHVLGPDDAPTVEAVGQRRTLIDILLPNAALVLVAAAVGVIAWALGRRVGALRGLAAALVVAVMLGFSFPPTGVVLVRDVRQAADDNFALAPATKPQWPDGTREAARWLRRHSDPDDLVATNAHCRRREPCDNLHFWFSAYAERRFLVEGWGYTPTANRLQSETGQRGNLIGYWDLPRLAANDAAFHHPSVETVDRLRTGYGVRWLFVDKQDRAVRTDRLDRFATLRFRRGSVAVYQL